MKFKLDDKVKAIENHPYLGITKRQIGKVVEIMGNRKLKYYSVLVEFKSKTIVFQSDELRKA